MKPTICVGAYGWRHKHWLNTFYPEDLPVGASEDWRLSYYSNEFNIVLVPSAYWKKHALFDCGEWLDDVHDDFRFFIECHESMFEYISPRELTDNLKKLQSQLSGLVFLDEQQAVTGRFNALIDALEIDVFQSGLLPGSATYGIWRQQSPQASNFAFIESDLSDLKSARAIAEDFVHSLEHATQQQSALTPERQGGKANIIVSHPQLQASNLSKFRSILEIMGY